MQGLAWLTVPIGLVLIGLAVLDVFLTVLHVQVESPISNHLNRRLWRLLLAVGRRLPTRTRGQMLSWGAPLMIGGILVFWSILYIVGFTLLYLPFIHDPAVFALGDVGARSPIGDAIYFSGLSFFTIGYGDILPIHPVARLLAILEAAFGLTTLSFSVTYLLSVYPLIVRKIGMAESLNQETAGRSDAVVLAQRYVGSGRYEALAQRLSGINDELLALGQSHGMYPVLYYVRPRDPHQSFVRVLAVIQGLVTTLRYGLDPDEYPDVATDPRLLILEEGLLSTIHTLADSSHLAPRAESRQDWEQADRDFLAMIEELRRHGLAARSPDDAEAREAHAGFRVATDRYIHAYAENAGYDAAVARARYSRWDRDTALVGRSETADGDEDGEEPDSAPEGGRSGRPERDGRPLAPADRASVSGRR